MTIESPRQDIVSIQSLRGIAAMMVVFVHLDIQLGRLGYQAMGSDWGSTGVDIFFVISGFIMWISAERHAGMTADEFMRNRLIRIVPLYWLVTTLVLVVLLVAPQLLKTTTFDFWHVLSSYLFIPQRHPLTDNWWPLLIPGWTLNFEMLFYLLFAIAIFVSRGSALMRFAAIAGLILGWMALAYSVGDEDNRLSFYANAKMLEFLAGIVIAIVFRTRNVGGSTWWLLLVAAGFGALFASYRLDSAHSLLFVLVSTAIVAGAVFGQLPAFASLKRLGDCSYSLYLTHVITLAAVSVAWNAVGLGDVPAPIFILVALASCILVADLSYRMIEIPATRRLKARFPDHRRRFLKSDKACECS